MCMLSRSTYKFGARGALGSHGRLPGNRSLGLMLRRSIGASGDSRPACRRASAERRRAAGCARRGWARARASLTKRMSPWPFHTSAGTSCHSTCRSGACHQPCVPPRAARKATAGVRQVCGCATQRCGLCKRIPRPSDNIAVVGLLGHGHPKLNSIRVMLHGRRPCGHIRAGWGHSSRMRQGCGFVGGNAWYL
jgi:hypothetical protein